jgi:hypothetical protein
MAEVVAIGFAAVNADKLCGIGATLHWDTFRAPFVSGGLRYLI